MAADALPLGLDPLIAEAKERARRRRLLALCAVVVVAAAAAIGTTYGLRSSGNALSVCATAPSGWKERTPSLAPTPPTVVLTNFRFGRMDDVFGITDPHLDWPANGVLVAVGNWPPDSTGSQAGPLRVTRSSFAGMEGSTLPTAHFGVRSHGRILDVYVTVGTLTPATIAAANQALAGVRTCSA
jgi:hypothetical protein